MSAGLRRFQTSGHDHAINFSCFRHRFLLGTPEARDTFLNILEETRIKYDFAVYGYVVMPNHVHLLLSEPKVAKLSTVIQVIKQRFSRTRSEEFVWDERYYDFNVITHRKFIEKLRYIHRNPVRANLAEKPEEWQWSSFRFYLLDEPGLVTIHRGIG